MAKFIKQFYDFLTFVEGSDITTRRPPEQIDEALYFVIMVEFNEWIKHYPKTKEVEEMLMNFKRKKDITLSSGIGSLPPDYGLYREIFKSDGKTKIDVVEDLYWPDRINRKIGPVTEVEPVAKIEFSKAETPVKVLEVYPATLPSVEMHYFKTPTKPKYAYDIVSDRYVYNDTNSIDIEFSIFNYPNLLYKVAQMVSVNLRDTPFNQYMQNFINQQTGK